MKPARIAAIVFAAGLALAAFRTAPGTLSQEDRKYAIDYYQKTRTRLLKDLKGLSETQLSWKADTSRWSIYECTEHIALTEAMIWQWIQMTEHQPANPEKRSEVKLTNEALIAMLLDRSHKVKTNEMMEPRSQWPTVEAALRAYNLRRDSTIAYIKVTQDDLKDHFLTGPFGTIDCYQGLIFLAAHSERHTEQIEEVMNDPNFPKQ
jgi:hypothetical protein